ncbi:MAG: sugar-binding domain-containing protein [Bacteroidota bacterium]
MNRLRLHHFLLLTFVFISCVVKTQTISLAGTWRFATDPGDKGVAEKWFDTRLADEIKLPGSMTENMKGDEVTLQTKWTGSIYDSSFFFRTSLAKYRQPGNVKIPFWLTQNKYYTGAAWYQKDVVIPATWTGKQVTIFLERCHFQSTVWVDGKEVGSNNSLVVAHQFDLTKELTAGKHTITIRIDNRIKVMNVGPDSHSVSDHTQGNWNGIVGKMLLQAGSTVQLSDIQVYPDIKNKLALVKLTIINAGTQNAAGKIVLSTKSFNSKTIHMLSPVSADYKVGANDTAMIDMALQFGNKMLLWDEFDPALYKLTATVNSKGSKDEKQVQFGMREIKANGNHLEINGRPVYLRGDLNNCEFPLTGYAPMDVESWRRIFSVAKAHGLNHMRFHSWCPPEAAFIAADESGFYLQPEGPTWPNHGTSLGDGRFIDKYVYDETNRMEKAYGNYASYCMLASGNEPAGRNHAKYLREFVRYWQAKDKRRVYTGASVAMSWPLYPESDFMIKSGPRNLNWTNTRPETVTDYHAAIENFKIPYVTHEMGQWCVFPNFKEIKKYTGVTRAKNFELFREDLADHGMADRAEAFFMASGKLQALCYKQEIEKSFRTKNGAGFQLLGLQDFPGQGSALIGVLDAFWEEKGYITAGQWKRFCNSTVPLSRIAKFTYSNDETFEAAIEIYHFGKSDMKDAVVAWTIKDEKGTIVKNGKFPATTIATGGNTSLGKVVMSLSGIKEATRLNLEVVIDNTSFANDWSFWVYPAALPAAGADDIYYTNTLDAKAEETLTRGGKVFLNAAGKVVKGKEIVMQFTPVFWNTSWFKMRPPHVTGFVAESRHPLFKYFPTEYHSDLQWWEIVNKAQVMHLEDFPKGFQPIVQPIDTWFMNRKLGLIMEAKVGNGKLIVSSANLSDTSSGPAAKQLLYSIKKYIASEAFDPKQAVSLSLIKDLFITPSKEVWDSFTKATPDELKPQNQKNTPN